MRNFNARPTRLTTPSLGTVAPRQFRDHSQWDLTAAARSPRFYGISLPQRDPPPPGFLGNCRGATVPTPAGGLPRSISVAPAPNSPPLFLRRFTLIVVPAAGTTMGVKTYARPHYSLGFSHSLCPVPPAAGTTMRADSYARRLYSLGFFTKRQPGLRVPMSDAPPRWSVRQTPLPLRPTSIPTRAAFIP